MNSESPSILLVEDNSNDVMLIRRALGKLGISAVLHIATDGDSAVRYLGGEGEFSDREAHPLPGLVLLDLKLPRRSGFEVIEWLRSQPGLRRLPVVVLSSSEQPADIARAYEAGANSYVVKPVRFDALLEILRAVHAYWFRFNVPAEQPQ